MGLYTEAPEWRSFSQDKPSLLVCWWCTLFATTVILFRVCGRYVRTEKLFTEDWLAFACIIPLFIRMAFVQVILLWGTNNSQAPPGGWTDQELYRREIGSKLVLGSRIFYAATLWMLKLTITEFFKRLIIQIWKRSFELMLRSIRWFLLITFIAVVISDISECQPITDYWRVSNPPVGPQCRQGFAQLLTMGICSVITDLLLVIFPIPIIIRSQMRLKRKCQLVLLFSLSIIPVGITLYRVPAIIARDGVQQYRSVWASVEILLATGVANALVLGSFVRDRGIKKAKFKFGSTSDSIERTSTRRDITTMQHWGSDEDLVRDMGLFLDPELQDQKGKGVRVAPMATSASTPLDRINENWHFPQSSDGKPKNNSYVEPGCGTSDDSVYQEDYSAAVGGSNDFSMTTSPGRKVSFFDIGGLLDDDRPARSNPGLRLSSYTTDDATSLAHRRSTSLDSQAISPTTSTTPALRRGSHALVHDVGGLQVPSMSARRGVSGKRKEKELSTRPESGDAASNGVQSFELQDISASGALDDDAGLSPLSSSTRKDGKNERPTRALDLTGMSTSPQDVGGLLK